MDVEINLKVLFKSFLKHIWLIVIITALVTLGTALYSAFMITPIYEATTVALVWTDDMNMQASGKYDYATKIINIYAESIKSDKTMEFASDLIVDEYYTPQRIRSMIEIEFAEGRPILYITAKSPNPDHAAAIANKVREAATYTIDIATLRTTREASIPTTPSSPSVVRNCIIAFFVSALLSYVICLFIDLSDTKITSEDQLTEILDVPMLGMIPWIDLSTEEEKRTEGGKSQVQGGTK